MFLLRAGGAAAAGAILEVPILFGLIPLAFVANYYLFCMVQDSKCAKNKGGNVYFFFMLAYNIWWIIGLRGFKNDECWSGRYLGYTRIYGILTFNMLVDFWLNRKWFVKIGRKYCLSQERKLEFKRIKNCKKQMKFARSQLELVEYQMMSAGNDK